MAREKCIVSKTLFQSLIKQIAQEILKRHPDAKSLVLLGIYNRGLPLAQRLQKELEQITGQQLELGTLDITLYRDDLDTVGHKPIVKSTQIPFDLTGKDVILVDDVLFTGRTVRAALNELVDFGRPHSIQLAVLVDRGHRELPIQADYVGKRIPTKRDEAIKVKLVETDDVDEVTLITEGRKNP
jgi:pyrimidine operon attenuation protein/uracil phosphoribosyltransferase